jgi:uncharacterized protein
MISLQKLFGKTDVFYSLLQQSAEEARHSIQAVAAIFTAIQTGPGLEELRETKRKDKKITEQINEALCTTFVTELEREDIEALSVALYKIPKTVEKIGERYIICADKLNGVDFSKNLALMLSAADLVVKMVTELCSKMHLEQMKGFNAELQRIEGDADKLVTELLKDLYHKETDAVRIIMLRDLYDLMEKVVDRCRDAGNVLTHIVLKYS